MATLYLIEQNTILRKTSDRVRLCRRPSRTKHSKHLTQDQILLELPCADIDHVMLFGNIQVTTQALQELLQHGIELAIFTFSGRLIGQLTPPKTKNIYLRIDQFKRMLDNQFCLTMSRRVVHSKIKCMLTLLKKYQYNHPDSFSIEELNSFETIDIKVNQASSIDSLRGFEGSASAAYFKLFGRMFTAPWKFTGRNRRPPKDPINAVLSFGYVVVGAEIQALLDGIGFDPYLGFYHVADYGRPSLALDLLEEFRHSLVDQLALNLFNLGKLNKKDFYDLPEGGVYLSSSGKKKFFLQYEKMQGEFISDTDTADKKTGFRALCQQRIRELANTIKISSSHKILEITAEEDFDI